MFQRGGWLPGINTDVKTPTLMLAYPWDAQLTLLESYARIYMCKHSFRRPLIPSSSTLSVFSGQEMQPSPLCNMTPGSEDGGKNTTEWGKYTTCGAENSPTHFWSDKIKPTAFPTWMYCLKYVKIHYGLWYNTVISNILPFMWIQHAYMSPF